MSTLHDSNHQMGEVIQADMKKIDRIMEIKVDFLKNRISQEEAKLKLRNAVDFVTADEFAFCEHLLTKYGISDDTITERIEEIREIFEGLLRKDELSLPEGHPIHTYLLEVQEIRVLITKMNEQLQKKFIKNQWLELYDQLEDIHLHFARKQNQLFPRFEDKDFDKPSKVMWSLENAIRNQMKEARDALEDDRDKEFLALQKDVLVLIEDMMDKEEEVLYPTALKMISDREFIEMRKGDDEIGYAFGITPKDYHGASQPSREADQESGSFMDDLKKLMKKHGLNPSVPGKDHVLDVTRGKLTLEQVNLIFQNLPVDLSFVDEHELVKFYSDTPHRVFPRSPGVIDRKVENCHPRESVSTVKEIIEAFKNGKEDQAEFWLELGDRFIYILFVAIRDENNNFRGVLEVMQDVTRIRSLTGSQRLLSWNQGPESNEVPASSESIGTQGENSESGELTPNITRDTVVGELIKNYPYLKDELLSLSPKFSKLKNPILFKTMSSIATMEMIAERGNLNVDELIAKLEARIDKGIG